MGTYGQTGQISWFSEKIPLLYQNGLRFRIFWRFGPQNPGFLMRERQDNRRRVHENRDGELQADVSEWKASSTPHSRRIHCKLITQTPSGKSVCRTRLQCRMISVTQCTGISIKKHKTMMSRGKWLPLSEHHLHSIPRQIKFPTQTQAKGPNILAQTSKRFIEEENFRHLPVWVFRWSVEGKFLLLVSWNVRVQWRKQDVPLQIWDLWGTGARSNLVWICEGDFVVR